MLYGFVCCIHCSTIMIFKNVYLLVLQNFKTQLCIQYFTIMLANFKKVAYRIRGWFAKGADVSKSGIRLESWSIDPVVLALSGILFLMAKPQMLWYVDLFVSVTTNSCNSYDSHLTNCLKGNISCLSPFVMEASHHYSL